jgi:hypothetical protein
MTKYGFPDFELGSGNTALMKPDHVLSFKSKYETGDELTSDRELKQAGLNPKDVKHTVKQADDGSADESTSVKYPNGIEVTVSGHTKHKADGKDDAAHPTATIKEPLPKGYHKDKDGGILDASNKKIGQINEDGTVTMKVGDQYVTQGPAGVTEATVFESKHGSGMIERLKVKH